MSFQFVVGVANEGEEEEKDVNSLRFDVVGGKTKEEDVVGLTRQESVYVSGSCARCLFKQFNETQWPQ